MAALPRPWAEAGDGPRVVVGNEDATKKWVNARIGIAGTDKNSIEEAHTFTVTAVDMVDNRGTKSVTIEVAVTLSSTIQRVLALRDAGHIKSDKTLSALNVPLQTAKLRLLAGDRVGAIAAIEAFRRTVTSPVRRGLIDQTALAILTSSADYLLHHPAP